MGASFCAVFEAEVPPYGKLGGDHMAILLHQDRLERLAADVGLTPLGAFESYDPADAAEFLDEDEEDELADLPPARWFAASVGLAAVDAMVTHLTAHPNVFTGQAEVLADLTGVAAELANADRTGVRFRFAIVS